MSNLEIYPAAWLPNHFDIGLSYPNTPEFPFAHIADLPLHGTQTSELDNIWIHYCIAREKNQIRVFRNGVMYNSGVSNSRILDPNIYLFIGRDQRNSYTGNTTLNGMLDDVCIIAGKALWTENFTPPTTYLPDEI